MRQRIIPILTLILLVACKEQIEPQSIAGYIADCNEEMILIKSDSTSIRLKIDDNTALEHKEILSGNIVEAIYLPSEKEGELAKALEIYTDETYPKALGHWQSSKGANPKIDIQLLSHGRIQQNSPQTTLQFTRWQLSGKENHIKLFGTLSLPPVFEKKSKEQEKKTPENESAEELLTPQRRPMHFEVMAELSTTDDSKTESHRVMIIQTEKGHKSTLYFSEE
ncbi:MAG: hypothetical protein U0L21_05885 [Alistipes sp.]|nr:hypothetical protein [Alistipes sp.]